MVDIPFKNLFGDKGEKKKKSPKKGQTKENTAQDNEKPVTVDNKKKEAETKTPSSSQPGVLSSPAPPEKKEIDQEDIYHKIDAAHRSRSGFGRIIKHPLRTLTEKPLNILVVTAPLAIIIFLVGVISFFVTYGPSVLFKTTLIDDLVVISVVIICAPIAVLDFRESHRSSSIERALPNFFRDLAGMNDSGMTLTNAVHLISQSEYGALTPHIKKLDDEISWNIPFIEAIYKFGYRLGSPLAERSVDLIAKASKAGGDVAEVLRAAANDTYEFVILKTERSNNMLIYVIIVLASFFVFLFVIFILVSSFLTTMATVGASAAATGSAGAKFGAQIDLFIYTRLFSHAAMIQGFFSGLCAGQMGEGRVMAGLKYSVMMLLVAWIAFRFFI
jgi:archaeal flagellar protein FlaJ